MAKRSPPFNGLYSFIITAKHLNFTHAAEELFVTQGAVSRQIAALESYLGFKVFHRHARGLELTDKGKDILPSMKQAFDQIMQTTQQAMHPSTDIKMKAPTCSMRWLVPKLIELENDHPDIQVALTTTTEHGINFETENFDMAVVFSYDDKPDESGSIKLFDEQLTPVISPTIYNRQQPFDINNYTFLHPSKNHSDWALWLNEAEIDPAVMVKNQFFETMDLSISAAIQGFGVAIADINLVKEDIVTGRLICPSTINVNSGAHYYLRYAEALDQTPHIAKIVDWLNAQISKTSTPN